MPNTSEIQLIVGLGNIGAQYANTRHNAGFWFVDALARSQGVFFREENKFHGEVARVRLEGRDVWLLKPSTYMNLSGDAVVALALYYKILPDSILVVHDDLDLMPGCMKFKNGGGNAGHNGLKDITAKLSTPNFWRLRLGIGHPRTLGMAQQVADYVLSAPAKEHMAGIEECISVSLKNLPALIAGDMNRFTRAIAKYGSPKKPEAEKIADKPAKAATE